jgi:hypothetical protein
VSGAARYEPRFARSDFGAGDARPSDDANSEEFRELCLPSPQIDERQTCKADLSSYLSCEADEIM